MSNHQPTYVTIVPVDSSWPSGHTMTAYALATILFFYNKKLGLICYFLAGVIGLGRILANVHYPIDIFSGLVAGVTIGAICGKIKTYDSNKRNNSSSGRKTKK